MTEEQKTEETETPQIEGDASVNPETETTDDGFAAVSSMKAQQLGLPVSEADQRVLSKRLAATGIFQRIISLFSGILDLGGMAELLTGLDLSKLPEFIKKVSAVRSATSLVDGIVLALEAFKVWAQMTVSDKDDHLIEIIDKIIGEPKTLEAFENVTRAGMKTMAGREEGLAASGEFTPLDLGNNLAGPDDKQFQDADISIWLILPLIKAVVEFLYYRMSKEAKAAIIES